MPGRHGVDGGGPAPAVSPLPIRVFRKIPKRTLLKAGMAACVGLGVFLLLFPLYSAIEVWLWGLSAVLYITLAIAFLVTSPAEGRWGLGLCLLILGSPLLAPIFVFLFAVAVWSMGRFAP